jgi:hypothetical protein
MTSSHLTLWILPILLAIACCGCEVETQAFKREPLTSNRSVIYVYRPYSFLSSGETDPDITCGHSTIAIGAGGYHAFVEEPGKKACYANTNDDSRIEFETRPETDYFIREEVSPSVTQGTVTLKQVDRSTGLSEIDSCEMQ